MPDLPNPESRVEQYLANLTDGTTEIPKEPESRIEQYLDYLTKNGTVNYGTAPAAAAGMALVAKTIVDGKVTEWEFGDAGGLKIHICTSSEYGQVSREPVISSPDEKTLYLVPSADGSAPDLFVEWAYVNGNWEMFGSASIGNIPDSVNEWLTEHITNPDNPPLDRSLTSSSAAAPADLVGEELTNLKQDLEENVDDLKTAIAAIEEAEGLHRYGVSGIGQSANALTRLWDSVGMTAQVGTDGDNSNVINNFDDVTPFNRRKCVGDWYVEDGRAVFRVNAYLGDEDYAEDGTMGDFVAVECPRAYYYFKDGVLGISAHQYSGWRPFDIFCHKHDENETIPFYYHPAYALVLKDGKAVSLPGYDNEQGCYKDLVDAARTYKSGALGNLAMLMPAAYNFYEWALFTVEFANQNCQAIMQGCAGLRHSNDDRVTFVDATHILTSNYYTSRVAGQYIAIITTSTDINAPAYKATHKVVSVTRCDEYGVASASGTHQLMELQDLGKNYLTYDTTGTTEYRIAARPYRTGDCNGVSTPSGSPVSNSDSYHPCKYRWHENPFSNQFKTAMDLFNQRIGTGDDDYYLDWHYLDDPTGYAPSTTSKPDATDLASDKFVKLDVNTPHANYLSGFIKSKKYSEHYPDVWIPDATSGGSTSSYFCDYAYLVYSYSVRACRFGGSWYNGASAGFSYLNGYNAPSYSNAASGGDLCFAQ